MTSRRQEGFTLVELLVTIALFSVVSIGFYSVMLSTVRGSDVTETAVRISEEARAGFNRMIRDVREAEELTITEPDRLGIRTDFNNDGQITTNGANSSGDFENLVFERLGAGRRIVVRTCTTCPPFTLIEGIVTRPGQSAVFSYSSNLLEYDANGDGIATCGELNQGLGLTGGSSCANDTRPFISNVDFAFDVVEDDQRTSFFAQAQLRNSRD